MLREKLFASIFAAAVLTAGSAILGAGPLECLAVYSFSGLVMFLALTVIDLMTDEGDHDEY